MMISAFIRGIQLYDENPVPHYASNMGMGNARLFDGTRGLHGLRMEAEGEKGKAVGCPSETVSLV